MSKEHTAISSTTIQSDTLEYTPLARIPTVVQDLQQSSIQPLEARKQQLRQLLQGIEQDRQMLLDACYADLRKPHQETQLMEVGPAEFEISQMLDRMEEWLRPEPTGAGWLQPGLLLSRSEVHRDPLGTVVIIGPWNYPLRLMLIPLVGALAAGNCVVLKPSEVAPHCALALEQLVGRCLDPKIVKVVQGAVEETALLLKQRFDHYFYTGSGAVGKLVGRAAADQLAGVTLELGGKTPALVHADVGDLRPVAFRIVWSKLINSGQTCTATDYLLVHRSVRDRLLPLMAEAVKGLYGEQVQMSEDYGRIINQRHWQRLMDALEKSQGTPLKVTPDIADQADLFIPPTLMDGVQTDDALMQDELFGPILPIVTYETLDEALALISQRDPPLALYVFAQPATAQHVIASTRSGAVVVNDTMFHMVAQSAPFGGVGASGVGRYTGKYSIETFSHLRHVMGRPLWFPSPGVDSIRGPPYGGKANQWKLLAGPPLVGSPGRAVRKSLLSKLFTFIPGWRLLAVLPGFLAALVKAKAIINK